MLCTASSTMLADFTTLNAPLVTDYSLLIKSYFAFPTLVMRLLKNFCGLLCAVLLFNACSKKDTPPPPPPASNPPSCTNNSAPLTGATVVSGTSITLSWAAVSGAASYDVYLDTMASPAITVSTNISTTSLTYTVPAGAGKTYYWYVVPKNGSATATGCASRVTSFTSAPIQAPPPFGFYVVGYFPSYRNLNDIPDIKFRMCNVVNYAFFSVSNTGTLNAVSPALATQMIAKAKAANAKAFLSINDGAGDGKTYFKNMASTATGRTNFIKDVMNNVRQFGFDGVDVDWEFPTTSDGTDVTFTALMKELSDSLHLNAKYYLTAAITAGKYAGGIRDAIKTELFSYVDFLNVMAYDDFNTAVSYKHHSDYALATTCLNYWLNTRNMPQQKCVLGLPAYGRPSGITQTSTVLTYKDILSRGGSSQSDSAVVTNGGFTNYTIYYNGQPTIKKKAILAKQTANGVMMWEKWQDAMDGNSLLKAACDTVGRSY